MNRVILFFALFMLYTCAFGQQVKAAISLKLFISDNNGTTYQIDQKKLQDVIKLNYSQNNLYFILDTNDSSIQYKLIDVNRTWITVGKTQHIHYANLAGNKYEFIVKGLHESTSVKFVIDLPFWQKWWFYPSLFLYMLFIIGAIYYIFFYYRLRQQLRLQTVRHELEIKALRAQMNPHFIFNSMNTIDAYILRKKFIEASDCLQKFSKLIRRILENSEHQTISISQELETLKLYIELEQERFSHTFSYEFDIEPALLEKEYQIPPLLIQPFVENAILHGIRHLTTRKGNISVKLVSEKMNENAVLFCQIQDNGIGREKATEINLQRQISHKSMGIDITLERISTYQALYGNKMETRVLDLPEGTRIALKLPLILD